MFLTRLILGGMIGVACALSAWAEPAAPTIGPLSRDDAAILRVEAAKLALAGIRPSARPDYMLRYPVRISTVEPAVRPVARSAFLPRARWDFRKDGALWTRAAMSAVAMQGEDLLHVVPRDIEAWCPAYIQNPSEKRSAFWVGMMSTLVKYESTYNPEAVGGGGQWYGLLQILPETARRYGCRARSGEALTDPEDNLACAARILAVTVKRDRAVALHDGGRWRGVAADWGPMTDQAKVAEMASWTSAQSYCKTLQSIRPQARPDHLAGIIREARNLPAMASRLAENG